MESALRTAYRMVTGEDLKNVELKEVRGMKESNVLLFKRET